MMVLPFKQEQVGLWQAPEYVFVSNGAIPCKKLVAPSAEVPLMKLSIAFLFPLVFDLPDRQPARRSDNVQAGAKGLQRVVSVIE